MKKLIILLLCLSLIAACFIGCDSDNKTLDDKELSSYESSTETSEETTSEIVETESEITSLNISDTTEATLVTETEETSDKTTSEIVETESEITSLNTSDTVETTIVTESEETSEETIYYAYEPILFEVSTYEELESTLLGEDESKYLKLKAMFEEIPQAENFFNAIKEESDLVRPLINGIPAQIDYALIAAGNSPIDPGIVYTMTFNDRIIDVGLYYFDACHEREFSSYESLLDIEEEINGDSADWEEKIMQIGGESITVIEHTKTELPNIRRLSYYKDGVYVMLWTNNKDKLLTDEFLQSFSVGYVAPAEN